MREEFYNKFNIRVMMQKPYRDFLGTLYWCRGWHGFWVFKNAHPFLLNSKEILKFIYTLQWNILVSIQIYVHILLGLFDVQNVLQRLSYELKEVSIMTKRLFVDHDHSISFDQTSCASLHVECRNGNTIYWKEKVSHKLIFYGY